MLVPLHPRDVPIKKHFPLVIPAQMHQMGNRAAEYAGEGCFLLFCSSFIFPLTTFKTKPTHPHALVFLKGILIFPIILLKANCILIY